MRTRRGCQSVVILWRAAYLGSVSMYVSGMHESLHSSACACCTVHHVDEFYGRGIYTRQSRARARARARIMHTHPQTCAHAPYTLSQTHISVFVRATRDIKAGDELLVTYGTTYHTLHFSSPFCDHSIF